MGSSVIKNCFTTQQVDNLVDIFILAAKECGFITGEQIEENFEIIASIASEMVRLSKERVLTKLCSNPQWIEFLAAKYQKKCIESI